MELFHMDLAATKKQLENLLENAGDHMPTSEIGEENGAPMVSEPDKPMVEGAEAGETAVEKSLINEALANEAPATIKAPNNEGPATNETPPNNELLVSAEKTINTNDDQCRPRKKSSVLREKKMRQNRLLRRAILPRNALMALSELKGITVGNFSFHASEGGGFKAVVTVNTAQYEGQGVSKMAAKNAACEKALCDYMSYKIRPMPFSGDLEEPNCPDDDGSMLSLASFAIYKLFAEWERQGFQVPGLSLPANEAEAPPVGSSRSGLPKGWETMHPVSLLCVLRPNITFEDVDTSSNTDPRTSSKRVRVTVDSHSFEANGRSKKIARRLVAINACNELFGTNFSYPDTF